MKRRPRVNYKIIKNKFARQPYHWICVSANGQIRSHSENYSQKHNAINAVKQEIKSRKDGYTTFEDLTGETNKIHKKFK